MQPHPVSYPVSYVLQAWKCDSQNSRPIGKRHELKCQAVAIDIVYAATINISILITPKSDAKVYNGLSEWRPGMECNRDEWTNYQHSDE